MQEDGLHHVLVVEGDPELIRVTRKYFSRLKTFRAFYAGSLACALEAVAETPYDALVLDLPLPGGESIEAVARFTATAPGIAIVVLIAPGSRISVADIFLAGAEEVLVKDRLEPELLGRSIRHSMLRKRVDGGKVIREKTILLDNILRTSINMSIVATDRDFRIRYFNPAAEIIFAARADEVIGRTVMEIHAEKGVDPARFEAGIANVHARGEHIYTVEKPENEGGTVIESRVAGIVDPSGMMTGYLLMSRDITERRRAEKAMLRAKEEAETASRAKSEFIANMSHELRTPLNAIIGFSSCIQEELYGPITDDRYRDYAGHINSSGQHLLELINDILEMSAVESGKVELIEEHIRVRDLADAAIRMVKHRALSKSIALSNIVRDSLPGLHADRRRVTQILVNLLANAVKFTPDGGAVSLAANLDRDRSLLISVADTGIGMDADGLSKAMTPFGQVDSSWGRKYEGTGLGLPLAARLMAAHGGKLDLESTPGTGTTVILRFPASRVVPALTPIASPPNP